VEKKKRRGDSSQNWKHNSDVSPNRFLINKKYLLLGGAPALSTTTTVGNGQLPVQGVIILLLCTEQKEKCTVLVDLYKNWKHCKFTIR